MECIGEETEDSLCDNCGGTYKYAKENHVLFSGSCGGQYCSHGVHEGQNQTAKCLKSILIFQLLNIFFTSKNDNHFWIPDFPDIISVTSHAAANSFLPDLMGRYEKQQDFMTEGKPVYKKDSGSHFIFYTGKFSF